MTARDPLGSIFLRFLRFGLLAWGGPAAQIAMIDRECVEQERWVDEATFRRTLAVFQVLPGPEAHELCVYLGRIRGGRRGAFLAGLGFMLPGFLLMLGLSVLYVEAGLDESLDEVFYGLKAAVGALVASAVVRLGRKFVDDVPLALIAVASFVLTLVAGAGFLLVLGGAGVVYWVWRASGAPTPGLPSIAITPAGLLIAAAAATGMTLTAEVFVEGLKTGLLTFGGAYTAIPFLQDSAVDARGWITQDEFLDGLAMAGALPAPAVIFSTFIGYLTDGLAGGIAITVGVFLPAFVLPIFFHEQLVRVAESPRLRAFLIGVTAGVVGLIAAVTVDILEAGIVDAYTALLAVAAFIALQRRHGKLAVLAVVLGCGAIGALLQLTGAA